MATNTVRGKGPTRDDEFRAGEADIYPGMLLKRNTSGEVIKHTTEGGDLGDEVIIAKEDSLQGKTVDDVYADGAVVFCVMPGKGSAVNMLIEDEQNVSISNKIISAGNGKLKVSTDLESGETLTVVVGVADEANDLTVSDSDDTLSLVSIV